MFNLFRKAKKDLPVAEPEDLKTEKEETIPCSPQVQFLYNRFNDCVTKWTFMGCRVNNSLGALIKKDELTISTIYKFILPIELELDYYSKCVKELRAELEKNGCGETKDKEKAQE